MAVRGDERGAGVEANARRPGNERVVGKARVGGGIIDPQHLAGADRVHAEGGVEVDRAPVEAEAGFEPQPVRVGEGDERNRGVEEVGREVGKTVERRLGRGVQDRVALQGAAASRPRVRIGGGRGGGNGHAGRIEMRTPHRMQAGW